MKSHRPNFMAAAAGLIVAVNACKRSAESNQKPTERPKDAGSLAMKGDATKNCCMGLNECKGKGGCAVPESHSCAGKNECKGKGGCSMHCPK